MTNGSYNAYNNTLDTMYVQAKRQKHICSLTGDFETMFFSESPMSGEFLGRLIATGEWGVCLLSSCKVRYPQNKIKILKTLKG